MIFNKPKVCSPAGSFSGASAEFTLQHCFVFFWGGGLLIIKSSQIRGKSAFAWHSQISVRSLCVNCSKMQFESLQMPRNIKQAKYLSVQDKSLIIHYHKYKHLKYEKIVITILSVYC